MVMATLAQGAATLRVGVAFVVVHVRDCENNLTAGDRVRLVILRATIRVLWRSFTTILCALQDRHSKDFPFFRVY